MISWSLSFFWLFMIFPSLAGALPLAPVEGKLLRILGSPLRVALKEIPSLGPAGEQGLEKMAFQESWPLQTRWKAFMVLTQWRGKKSLPFIQKALVSPTWFMRNAGLTALESLDPGQAKQWAYGLLRKDPALMVRTKALEILKDETDPKVIELFWEKMDSPDSRHGQGSLWIRGDMARLLVRNPRPQDLKRWLALLHDQDKELSQLAALAFSKLKGTPQERGEKGSKSLSYWKKRFPLHSKF